MTENGLGKRGRIELARSRAGRRLLLDFSWAASHDPRF